MLMHHLELFDRSTLLFCDYAQWHTQSEPCSLPIRPLAAQASLSCLILERESDSALSPS